MKNRFLAILLSLVMLQAMLPVSAFAADEAGDAAAEADEAAETVEDVGQAKLARVQNTDPNFEINEDGVLVAYHGPGGFVTIPDGVIAIGDFAFHDADEVTGVNIPESVTIIGELAFAGIDNLTSVMIPASVNTIEAGPFAYCISLTEINVADGNSDYQDIDGVLFDDTGVTLIQFPAGRTGEYEIPEGVETIAAHAFRSSDLSEIIIPESVTTIKEHAFWGSNVREFYIPASVTTIEEGALTANALMEYIEVDENNNDFVSIYGVLFNADETRLIRCPATMKDSLLILPDSVTTIDPGAFSWCRELTKVVIPDGVTTIESDTFQDCRNLTTVVIPDSVTTIEDWAFTDCDNLTDVYYAGTEAEWNNITIGDDNEELQNATVHYNSGDFIIENGVLVEYIGQGGAVTIPEGVTTIDDHAFYGANTVTSVSIPASVTTIEDLAFIWGDIASITVDPGNANYSSESGVLYNKDKTELVKVPRGKVSPYTIPGSVTTIGTNAFRNCDRLDEVIIPESVTTIEDTAFWSCYLSSIEIPASVTSIGEGALGIYGLEDIRVADGNEYFMVDEDGVLFSKDKTKLIRCPVDKTEYDIPAGVDMIGDSAFVWCDLLEDVTIPNSVTTIGDSAFQNCALTSIGIPDSVTYIGNNIFYYTDIEDIYYAGSQSDWNRISIMGYNEELYDANIHFGRTTQVPSDDDTPSRGDDDTPSRPKGDGSSSSSSTEKKDETPVTPEQPVTPPAETNTVGQSTFSDVPATEWYNQAVSYVSENNIMSGSNGRFSPNERLTRGMMAQILYNIENASASGAAAFPDVTASDWFAAAVSWVSSQNYMSGYSNGRFGPNDSITREQLAVILYRYAQAKGYNVTGSAELSGFVDAASVSDWSADAVRWAVSVGLLSGKSGSRLDPAGSATRAEVAQILMNFATKVAK